MVICIGVSLAVACSDDGASTETASESSTTTTTPPGPALETDTDDVEAAMRSLLEFEFWAQRNPEAALGTAEQWLEPGSSYEQRIMKSLRDQASRELVATGEPEILEIRVESQSETEATVLVWLRSDAYELAGRDESLPSPAFERTLFVEVLGREAGGRWRVSDVRIPSEL